MNMKRFLGLIFPLFLVLLSCENSSNTESSNKQVENIDSSMVSKVENTVKAPLVELVFCLDATGSMSGLIHTAKEKIWDIVTIMSQSSPTPDIRLGMVFYRDLGDDFVTKSYPLTANIDSIYSELLAIQAAGGGDSPESVNQALSEAVSKMGWTTEPNVYRTIFLVGDCPPHMDYQQDIKYEVSCKSAQEQSIIINTIKLGLQCEDAIAHFKEIANLTNGEYLALGQNAEDVVIETPYDDSIGFYSNKIDASMTYYGTVSEKAEMYEKKEKAKYINSYSSSNAVASRAKYNSSEAGKRNLYGKKELIEGLGNGKVNLEEIKKENLPDTMQNMSLSEQKEYVEKLKTEREKSTEKLKDLTKKRDAYIIDHSKNDSSKTRFSDELLKIMKSQAKSSGAIVDEG